jgi:hypothetical protein
VRPLIVVIEPVVFCDPTGVSYAHEPVQIQAFIPELAVETLHIGIINRLPRPNKVKLHAALIRPCINALLINSGPLSTKFSGSPRIDALA